MMIRISSITQEGYLPASPTMDHLTEGILHLTLEIICLLTGESFPSVKSGDHVMIKVSPLSSVIINRRHKQKILEVTNRIIELLAGETGHWSRCHILGKGEIKEEDAGMEEVVYLEGNRELYKATMLEVQPPLTSPDGSSEETSQERPSHPLYSAVSSLEDHMILAHDQDKDVIAIKVEVIDEEQSHAWTDQQGAMKEKEGVIPTTGTVAADGGYRTRPSCGGNPTIQNTHPGLHSGDGLLDPTNPEESSENSQRKTETKRFKCPDCGKSFSKRSEYVKHERVHTGEKPFQCLECGKYYTNQSVLAKHQKLHTGEKPFSCCHCGKRFSQKAHLLRHYLLHTGEKPLTCPDCGKCFARKSNLIDHQRTHTGEKPFPCPECDKSFTQKSNLIRHQRTHRDERIIICSQCGKYFTHEAFVVHQSIHRGEEPFPCYKCGQCFTQKSDLLTHQRCHAGERTGLS